MVLVDQVGINLDEYKPPQKIKRPNIIFRFLGSLFLILFFSLVIFAVINFPAYILIYKFRTDPQSVAVKVDKPQVEQLGDNTIVISKIGVKEKIAWDTPQNDVMGVLGQNLAHLAGSGRPGDNKNIFITGHSSNYWWREGSLNTVFALLPELSENDEIIVTSGGKIFKYKVTQKLEVSAKKTTDYFQADSEQLTLMTCVPVGTNLKRLLVIAKPT